MKRQTIRKSLLSISFILFHLCKVFHLFFSPVLIVFAASQGIVGGSMITFVLLFFSALIFGRAFCGWLCPGGGLQELCTLWVHKPIPRNKYRNIKFVIFGIWCTAIIVAALSAKGFHAIDPFWGMGFSNSVQSILLFCGVTLIVVPSALVFGKWASCQYICWLAPILIAGSKIKSQFGWLSLHLQINPNTCVECHACEKQCPMSLAVMEMVNTGSMENRDCILCGNCVDSCRPGVIQFAFFPEKNHRDKLNPAVQR